VERLFVSVRRRHARRCEPCALAVLANGSTDWLDRLTADPELRYVSDGDPKTISYPDGAGDKVGEAYASRARPNS
jgi:hypothetical protein